jgi:hypothetical protein
MGRFPKFLPECSLPRRRRSGRLQQAGAQGSVTSRADHPAGPSLLPMTAIWRVDGRPHPLAVDGMRIRRAFAEGPLLVSVSWSMRDERS